MAFGVGGIAALSSDPASAIAPTGSQSSENGGMGSEQDDLTGSQEKDIASSQELEKPEVSAVREERVQVTEEESSQAMSSVPSSVPSLKTQNSGGITSTEASSFSISDSVVKSFSSTPGYLANRWNAVHSFSSTPSSSRISAPFATPSM